MNFVVKIQIGEGGPVVTIRGRDAWALLELKAANDNGCTPIDHPGPRWSGYVHKLRKAGIIIETVRGDARWPLRWPACTLCAAEPDYYPRNEGRQVVMAIAGLEIVAGGASVPPAFKAPPMSRTITNGVLGRVEAGHAIRRASEP
jgi:hypothetical protein